MDLSATITVRRPAPDVYAFWRRMENLPAFMTHLERVRTTGDRTSHWTSSAVLGRTLDPKLGLELGRKLEWDTEVTEDVPGARLAWRSFGDVTGGGGVRLRPAPDGICTEVRVRLVYDLPGGGLDRMIARYFGDDPHEPLLDALRRMKQLLETGEVTRSDCAPWGKRSRAEFPQRPARPLSTAEVATGPPG